MKEVKEHIEKEIALAEKLRSRCRMGSHNYDMIGRTIAALQRTLRVANGEPLSEYEIKRLSNPPTIK